MILILGKGALAQCLKTALPDAILLGRPEFDFAKQEDCDLLIQQYPTPRCIINTVGVIDDDIWTNLVTNFVFPAYITMKYLENSSCHIINISSASAWWPSYPGLDFKRFSYNVAKESLSQVGKHLNRIVVDDPDKLVTTVEPGKFVSKMSQYQGQHIEKIVNCIISTIDNKSHHISLIK
jgi:hypothetical protein